MNRSFRIETSGNLGQWTPWDIPGNHGLPVAAGDFTFGIRTPHLATAASPVRSR